MLRRRRFHAPGTAPGTYRVEHAGPPAAGAVTTLDYGPELLERHAGEAALERPCRGAVRWIRVTGAPGSELLEHLRRHHGLDALALEDTVNVGQRPKFSVHDDAVFVVLTLPDPLDPDVPRQLSLYLIGETLITFYEGATELFAPLEQRLERAGGALRRGDARYLLYATLDLAVDLLFPVLQETADQLERIETDMLERVSETLLVETHQLRGRLRVLRKIAWATREVVSGLARHLEDGGAVALRPFLQDLHDHVVMLVDLVETQHEVATDLVELYLSVVSNRMNEIMRVLTVIATLFIPPTFVVGVYGMNFDRSAGPLSMPELGAPLGYVLVLGFCALSMGAMLAWFRSRQWF